ERPREAAYAEATGRRRGEGAGRSWIQEIIVLLLTIAIGTGGVWAARQLRAPVDSALEARVVLEEQIRDRTAVGEELREDIETLRAQTNDLEGQFSTPADDARAMEAENASQHAGTVAVYGPGIEVELTEPSQPSSPEEHVLDVDVQIVV